MEKNVIQPLIKHTILVYLINDSTILKQSSLWKLLEENKLNLPDPKPFSETHNMNLPYIFLGDEAFTLTIYFDLLVETT